MFSKIAVAVIAFATFAAAVPVGDGQCQTGPQYCCNSLQQSNSPVGAAILSSLGVVAGVTGDIGLNCSPISVIGAAANSCKQQPVCCNGNSFEGAVVLGCSPININ